VRIASIYLPSFPLQAALAMAPIGTAAGFGTASSATAPVAVVAGPVVVACSRAAWARGVRPGMVVAVARMHAAELVCLVRDALGEAELVRTLADALLALTPSIDLGGPVRGQHSESELHRALFVQVPAGKRGSAFGARVVEVAESLGLRVRVGIADDRFTAAVAASHGAKDGHGTDGVVTCVPRGGAAAFLAPLPLALLSLPAEVQHMLEALGVRTLGAFAELPPPSVAVGRAWDADLQAFARGDGGTRFEAYQLAPRMSDRVAIGVGGIGAALQRVSQRLAVRLTGRGAARAEVELRLGGEPTGPAIELTAPYDADSIADDLARALGGDREPAPTRLELHAVAHEDDELETPVDRGLPTLAGPLFASAALGRPAAEVESEDVAPLVLTAVPSVLGHRPEHRRTRRGKQRPRIASGQARLFSR